MIQAQNHIGPSFGKLMEAGPLSFCSPYGINLPFTLVKRGSAAFDTKVRAAKEGNGCLCGMGSPLAADIAACTHTHRSEAACVGRGLDSGSTSNKSDRNVFRLNRNTFKNGHIWQNCLVDP